jgi:NitT/TauT family transport system substrate-binding protein
MSRPLRAVVGVVTALVLGATATACGSSSSGGQGEVKAISSDKIPTTPESGQFRMGIEPWIGYGAWWIAQDKQMFADHKMDTKITNFNEDAQINSALASGKIDGANIATHTAMKMIQSGIPVTAVLLEDQSTKADAIMAKNEITDVKSLKGKKVAYEEGTTSEILLSYALKKNGLALSDIQKVPMAASDVGTAILAGRVDVGVTYEPYLSAINQKSGYHYLFTAGENPGIVSDVLVVRNDVIDKKPGQVLALVKTWADAAQYLEDNAEEGQAIIAKHVGADAASLKSAFDGVKIYTLGESAALMAGEFKTKTVADVSQAAKDAKILDSDVTAKNFLTDSFVRAATAK